LAIRVLLASVFVLYGVLKLLDLQLSTGDLSDMRFGQASPMLVTWHFFSLSPLYHHSIGIAQVITGILLFCDHPEYRPDQLRLRYRHRRENPQRHPSRLQLPADRPLLAAISPPVPAGGVAREILRI
jgi:hypothetical protein